MSSSDYERGYSAGYHAGIRKLTKPVVPEIFVPVTEKEQAYAACQAAVDECHRLEREIGFPVWAEGIPLDAWPDKYVIARKNWDKLREERNRVYAA